MNVPEKRSNPTGSNRRNKKRRYRQHSNSVSRRDLGKGSRGFLISCTPKHEVQTFRDALVLLESHVDLDGLADAPVVPADKDDSSPPEGATNKDSSVPVSDQVKSPEQGNKVGQVDSDKAITAGDLTASLDAELAQLKAPKKYVIFEHLDVKQRGSVFVRVHDKRVNLEDVVKSILMKARDSGGPGCRFVQKIQPIHTTCYASPEEAAAASVAVVTDHFPKVNPTKYAIVFKARANTGAHRLDYINVIAEAILQKFGKMYTVDLTKPDVVLLVEVIKTSCCVGAFQPYFQLGKLNVREAAKPPKEKADKKEVNEEAMDVTEVGEEEKKVKNVGPEDVKKEEANLDSVGAVEGKKEAEKGKEKEEEMAIEGKLEENGDEAKEKVKDEGAEAAEKKAADEAKSDSVCADEGKKEAENGKGMATEVKQEGNGDEVKENAKDEGAEVGEKKATDADTN